MINSRIMLKRDTTSNWNNAVGFIPLAGEVIIYDDYQTEEYQVIENGVTVTKTKKIPGVKIGSGNAYVQDLAFVDEDTRNRLMEHINNLEIHVTLGDKAFWNNKINVDDSYEMIHDELVEETLVLNRN